MEQEVIKSPIVSVIVISYNSSEFIIDTLTSIFDQTYEHLELIVSDDASSDLTVDLCSEWLNRFGHRFVRAELVISKKNTGLTGNCNRGVLASNGEWVKVIAGDDKLKENCIATNVRFVSQNSAIKVCYSRCQFFSSNDKIEEEKEERIRLYTWFGAAESARQFQYLCYDYFLCTPTLFLEGNMLRNTLFDESYPMMEDWPLLFELTSRGIKIHYFNESTVLYRVHGGSITAKNTRFPRPEEQFIQDKCLTYYSHYQKLYYNLSRYYLKSVFLHPSKKWLIRRFRSICYRLLCIIPHKVMFR